MGGRGRTGSGHDDPLCPSVLWHIMTDNTGRERDGIFHFVPHPAAPHRVAGEIWVHCRLCEGLRAFRVVGRDRYKKRHGETEETEIQRETHGDIETDTQRDRDRERQTGEDRERLTA